MNIFTQIKAYISEQALDNLSTLLGESRNKVQDGLYEGINAFTYRLTKIAQNSKSNEELYNILSAGGHTGDVLSNFESFTSSYDRAKLLETIGSNTALHFMDIEAPALNDLMARNHGVKSVTAKKLLSLASPLVLGFLGKEVRVMNLQANKLQDLLKDNEQASSKMLSPDLKQYIDDLEVPMVQDSKTKKNDWSSLITWILLGLVALLLYFYFVYQDRNFGFDSSSKQVEDSIKNELETDAFTLRDPVAESLEWMITSDENLDSAAIIQSERKKTKVVSQEITSLNSKYFVPGSAEIRDGSLFDQILKSATENAQTKVILYPLKADGRVGVDRAYAIRDYLYENGLDVSRIQVAPPIAEQSSSGIIYKIVRN